MLDLLFLCFGNASWQWILYSWKAFLISLLNGATYVRNMNVSEEQRLRMWVALMKTCQIFSANHIVVNNILIIK